MKLGEPSAAAGSPLCFSVFCPLDLFTPSDTFRLRLPQLAGELEVAPCKPPPPRSSFEAAHRSVFSCLVGSHCSICTHGMLLLCCRADSLIGPKEVVVVSARRTWKDRQGGLWLDLFTEQTFGLHRWTGRRNDQIFFSTWKIHKFFICWANTS